MRLTIGDISKIIGCASVADDTRVVAGYSIDSRTVKSGDLFFAVRGERLDGHDYVEKALASGASAAVVELRCIENFPKTIREKLLGVPDTLLALQTLATGLRLQWGGPLVAVTGSAGKTTSKQIIAALLRSRFKVLESEKNLNNHFGLPLSLLRLTRDIDIGVFEMGMSAPGEIRRLAEIAIPDVGVVTNVSGVHLEFFPDVDAIARAKYELIEMLPANGWAVLNADDERVKHFGNNLEARTIRFGFGPEADLRAEGLETDSSGETNFTVKAESLRSIALGAGCGGKFSPHGVTNSAVQDVRFHLPLLGRHNVMNVLGGLAVAYLFGIEPAALVDVVGSLRPAQMRGELLKLPNGVVVVNDCYNSNPEAVSTMLKSVRAIPAKRRFAVLGGMNELGPASVERHHECGRLLTILGYDGLFSVGEKARGFSEGACIAGMRPQDVWNFDTPQEAGAYLREFLQPGDVVLFKASRSIRLEMAWEELQKPAIPAKAN